MNRGRATIHHPEPGEWAWATDHPDDTKVSLEGPCVQLYTLVPHAGGVRAVYAVVPVREVLELLVEDPVCRAEIDLAIAMAQLQAAQRAWAQVFGEEEALRVSYREAAL